MSSIPTSVETSFARLFEEQFSNLQIKRIEIPLIQRDYAQGRPGEVVKNIRENLLDALCSAVMPEGVAISLDFIYGSVIEKEEKDSTLYPLDGQQRLTTLFLLHWYLAWRAAVPMEDQPWTKFTYATRPGARMFCERLTKCQPPVAEIVGEKKKKLSHWLMDQSWYLYTWQHDPTIQSMLVMLDALHRRFCAKSDDECTAAWHRLTDRQQPAIGFHLLAMPDTTESRLIDELYIKMNSRGKPLTAFENFKADFEAVLNTAHPQAKADDFAKKVDTTWADILWAYRGNDNLIDEEFMRSFRFITEVCAWQDSVSFDDKTRIDHLAQSVYGKSHAKTEHLEFLFQAFDIWQGKNIKGEFDALLTATTSGTSTPLVLFNAFNDESPVDLFAACCRRYGGSGWTLAHTLLLYAILLNRIHNTADFPRQLRMLRNLIEASIGSEIRSAEMPGLLADVQRVIVSNTLQGVTKFNQAQVANENEKATLLAHHPALQTGLYRLEDHTLLRGCLTVFDLDSSLSPSIFLQRADAFHALFDNPRCWPELTGALLAIDDYSRQADRWTGYLFCLFGVSESETPWRDLFKGRKEPRLVKALMKLLDQVAGSKNNLNTLNTIQDRFLQQCGADSKMDWRYYFVKYSAMREGASGYYAISKSGYGVCMLNKTVMRSYYQDPYLLAILRESDVGGTVVEPWFFGYETQPREMALKSSGLKIQCVDQGWQITEKLTDQSQKRTFELVCSKHGIGQSRLYTVPQNNGIDTSDRVVMGADLLKALVNAGL